MASSRRDASGTGGARGDDGVEGDAVEAMPGGRGPRTCIQKTRTPPKMSQKASMSPVSMSLRCCGGGRLSFVVARAAAAAGARGEGVYGRAGGGVEGAGAPRRWGQPTSAARRARTARWGKGQEERAYLGELPVHGVDLLLEAGDGRE